jgi:hypothetical protein
MGGTTLRLPDGKRSEVQAKLAKFGPIPAKPAPQARQAQPPAPSPESRSHSKSDKSHTKSYKPHRPLTPEQQAVRKKRKERDKIYGVRQYLFGRYPAVFRADPKPLRVGIHEQIAAETNIKPIKVRMMLRDWTRQPLYLRALIASQHRYHLDGTIAEPITEEQREGARTLLETFMHRNQPHPESSSPPDSSRNGAALGAGGDFGPG